MDRSAARNHWISSLTDHGCRHLTITIKIASKIAESETTKVVAGQEISLTKNITGERNGANPESSTEPASAVMRSAGRDGVVKLSPRMEFGGLGRAHRSPSPPNGQVGDDV